MGKLGKTELYWEDALVIVAYFVTVLGVGIWSSFRSKKDTVSGYFLAGRSMHWIPVGASLFASNIGSGHFIGLAGSGASSGIGIAGFELLAIFILLILGWFFVPVYMASGVYTMPEYLRKRFGGQRIRIYLSVLALLLYVFTKISADLYAGAIFINKSMQLDMYLSIVILLAVAALFTIAGGLTAVMWTDFVQTILMLLGALALSILSFKEVGGYSKLIEQFGSKEPSDNTSIAYNAKNESCSKPPDNYMHLLRSPSDSELPWTGMIFGLAVNSVWYWCSDQVIVQRALSAKDLSHAKGGCILAGYLKLLPMFLLVFPGMAARVLFTDEIACSNPEACKLACGSTLGCTNIAYPKLVLTLMPAGARGLMMSVMLAALVSSLTSIFNSSSTIFTMDIWTRIRKQASEMELLIVGRVFVLVLVVISVAWIPIVEKSQNSQLFHYIQSVTAYLAPPVCAVYVLAILSKRINEQGAFWGLMTGLIIGLIRFGWELSYSSPSCASRLENPKPPVIAEVHYLHFALILFFITLCVTISVSLVTQPIAKEHLHRLIYWNRKSETVRVDMPSKKPNKNIEKELGQENKAYFVGEQDMVTKNNHLNAENDLEKPPPSPMLTIISTDGVPPKPYVQEMEYDRSEDSDRPMWKKALYFLCGVSKTLEKGNEENKIKPTPEAEAIDSVQLLKENPWTSRICNGNAILLIAITSFIYGYYA